SVAYSLSLHDALPISGVLDLDHLRAPVAERSAGRGDEAPVRDLDHLHAVQHGRHGGNTRRWGATASRHGSRARRAPCYARDVDRSEEHTSELQSRSDL